MPPPEVVQDAVDLGAECAQPDRRIMPGDRATHGSVVESAQPGPQLAQEREQAAALTVHMAALCAYAQHRLPFLAERLEQIPQRVGTDARYLVLEGRDLLIEPFDFSGA